MLPRRSAHMIRRQWIRKSLLDARIVSAHISTNVPLNGTTRHLHFSAKYAFNSSTSNPESKPVQNDTSESSIRIFQTPADLRPYRYNLRAHGRTVGLIPTMGALHEGHLSLARAAAAENHEVFFTIFVNPTQFGVHEDFGSYPRTFPSDMRKLEALNLELQASPSRYQGHVTAVFAPTTKVMYPTLPPSSEIDGNGSFVTITPLGKLLEGASRPVFFRGVATICTKLFNIVAPERVYFGQKDIQQTALIKRLVTDLHMDITVRIVPTERHPDGVAMSSRNVYLGSRRRTMAVTVPKALKIAEAQYLSGGEVTRKSILGPALKFIADAALGQERLQPSERARMELDYFSLADPESMEEVDLVDENRGAVLSIALRMLPLEETNEGEDLGESGGTSRIVRLIDNIILPPRAVAESGEAESEEARIEKLEEVVENTTP